MDKASLVITEVEIGAEALLILDDAGLGIKVAAWVEFPKYGDWRLVLASKTLDAVDSSAGISLVLNAWRSRDLPVHRRPVFIIMKMTDPFIRDLRRVFGKTEHMEGLRLGGRSFGGQFVADGYIYRIE